MSKNPELTDVLNKQFKHPLRKLTKRERKVIDQANRTLENQQYREVAFPKPVSFYMGDLEKRSGFIRQEKVVEGKLTGLSDEQIQKNIDIATLALVRQVYKFYGIKQQKKQERT